MTLLSCEIKIFRISPKFLAKIPNVVGAIVMQPDSAFMKFIQKNFFIVNPFIKILDSIISRTIALPSSMHRAICKKISTKNIFNILWTNTLPVFLVRNNLVSRKILKENIGLGLVQSGILNWNNSVLNYHSSSKVLWRYTTILHY